MTTKAARARATLHIVLGSRKELRAISDGLTPELLHPAGKNARARIVTRGRKLTLCFEAKDSATLRAIFSSYLRLLIASLNVCSRAIKLERPAHFGEKS